MLISRHRLLYIAVTLTTALIATVIFSRIITTKLSPQLTGDLPIDVPTVAYVGDHIAVKIGPVSTRNGTPIGLIMVGAHGPKVYHTVFESGVAHFNIPAGDTQQPGYLAFIAASHTARGEASTVLFSNPNTPIHFRIALAR